MTKKTRFPHKEYPGLEDAIGRGAQYKLVNPFTNEFYRIKANNVHLQFYSGKIVNGYPENQSSQSMVFDTRDKAYKRIKGLYTKLLKGGYVWEKQQEETMEQSAIDTVIALKLMRDSAASEKYTAFERLVTTPELPLQTKLRGTSVNNSNMFRVLFSSTTTNTNTTYKL